jgi:hypothetical protein
MFKQQASGALDRCIHTLNCGLEPRSDATVLLSRGWELAGGLNPQPAVYKTGADRPRRAGGCCPCSSGRAGRPASALLTGRVVAGGMTSRMTCRPLHLGAMSMRLVALGRDNTSDNGDLKLRRGSFKPDRPQHLPCPPQAPAGEHQPGGTSRASSSRRNSTSATSPRRSGPRSTSCPHTCSNITASIGGRRFLGGCTTRSRTVR